MAIEDIKKMQQQDARFSDEPNIKELIGNKKENKESENISEQETRSLTIRSPKKRDVKIPISARIDKSTKDKIDSIILANRFYNVDSKISFNEILNIALEEWASKKEHVKLRTDFENDKKFLRGNRENL